MSTARYVYLFSVLILMNYRFKLKDIQMILCTVLGKHMEYAGEII